MSNQDSKNSSWLSTLRNMLWPIYGDENRKFIPMLAMLSLALFNYSSLRITKDALIVTAPGSDAGVLNFLKGWVVLPLTFIFMMFYNTMKNKLSLKNLFYVILIPFLVFFSFFGLIFYPFSHIFHASPEWIMATQSFYPRLKYFALIMGYWGYALFYVMSELWGSIVIAVLFWQFANFTLTKDESIRMYPLFGAYSNIGLIVAGTFQYYGITTELTCLSVIISAFLLGFIYWWLNKNVFKDFGVEKVQSSSSAKKKKPGLVESAKLVLGSKYLGLIAIMVIGYGIGINLVETSWKQSVKLLYPSKAGYSAFQGKFFIASGIATMIIGLFLKNVVARFGWLVGALVTPIILISTSFFFYGFLLFSDYLLPASLLLGSTPILLAAILGSIQNIASKGVKYSLHDPVINMAYKPLDQDLQIPGKAAVDVLGSRIGKSMGGHVQAILLILTGGSQLSIAPYLFAVICFVGVLWILGVIALSKEYNLLLNKEKEVK